MGTELDQSPKPEFSAICLKNGFDAVKNRGKRICAPCFTFLYVPGLFKTERRFGILCSRKFDSRAVKRNRARRLVREALRLYPVQNVIPCGILIIPRRRILGCRRQEVSEQLNQAFLKAGLTPNPVPDSPPAQQ